MIKADVIVEDSGCDPKYFADTDGASWSNLIIAPQLGKNPTNSKSCIWGDSAKSPMKFHINIPIATSTKPTTDENKAAQMGYLCANSRNRRTKNNET